MKNKYNLFLTQNRILMKKLMMALSLIFGLGLATAQQTQPATAKKAETHKTEAKKVEKVAKATKAEAAKPGVKLKKDGTPDKRYKQNKHVKKDGTPDKRFKENKK